MRRNKSFLFLTLVASLAMTSCYHEFPKGGGGGGGGGNNNGNTILNLFVTATPSTTFSFPGITWQIDNISLVNSAGTTISLGGGFGAPFLTYPQLQTDSAYFGPSTVKATTYTKLLVTLGTPLFSYFYNSSNATLLGCAPGVVCQIPSTVAGFAANSTPVSVPISFTTTANTNTGIRVNFDFSKAVTTAGGMTFDFTQPGAITLIADPPSASSQTSGIDTIDNFTGVVNAVTTTTVTVSSFSSEQHIFTLASTVEFDDPFSICTAPATSACLAVGQNVSIDGFIASDSSGTRTATEIEFLDPRPAANELEGVIISPVTNNQFKMIVTNGMGTNTTLVSVPLLVNLSNATTFAVDPKNLGIAPTSTLGFESQSDLVLGQTVMVQGGTFSGSNTSITNPTRVLLRYSTISGTVQAPGSNIFTLTTVSPFFTNLTNNSALVDTFPGTAYDNISNFAGLSNVTSVSVRGLYLNPNSGVAQPLLAAKIRSH
jgi:hypothetical protein